MAERGREMKSKSRIAEGDPPPAAVLRAVLEFNFISRKMLAKQSMGTWRWI